MASSNNHYDDLLPNPCGSTSSNTVKRKADKFPFLISTFNTRLVLKDSRKLDLATLNSEFKFFFSMEMNIYTFNIKTTPGTMTFMGAMDTRKVITKRKK